MRRHRKRRIDTLDVIHYWIGNRLVIFLEIDVVLEDTVIPSVDLLLDRDHPVAVGATRR